jgi:hypothetical protein
MFALLMLYPFAAPVLCLFAAPVFVSDRFGSKDRLTKFLRCVAGLSFLFMPIGWGTEGFGLFLPWWLGLLLGPRETNFILELGLVALAYFVLVSMVFALLKKPAPWLE